MTDIVERLRQFDPETFGRAHAWEAADEIERLKAENAELRARAQEFYESWVKTRDALATVSARAALEPKP